MKIKKIKNPKTQIIKIKIHSKRLKLMIMIMLMIIMKKWILK
jgi:hypothetical protein